MASAQRKKGRAIVTGVEILIDAIVHYGKDPGGFRAVNTDDQKEPGPAYSDTEGRRCSVGRWLANAVETQSTFGGLAISEVFAQGAQKEDLFDKSLRLLPVEFWELVQELHDDPACWEPDGLSELGKGVVSSAVMALVEAEE